MEEAVAYFPGELVGQWSSFSVEDCFHCYTLRLERNFHYDVPFTDISLIVKCNLGPDLARTSFQMEVGRGSVTVNLDYAGVIHLSDEQVHLARKFQAAVLRILIDRDLSNLENALYGLHPQNDKVSRVAYLLLPSVRNQESLIIDWESLRVTVGSLSRSTVLASSPRTGSGNEFRRCHRPDELCRCVQTKNAAVCSCIVNNALVFTPHNGCFYCTDGFMDGLDGNSILKLRKGRELQYKEYYKSRYGITLHFEKESLIKGRRIFTPQNCVRSRNFQKEKEPTNVVELPPELCAVIMAPVSIATWYSFSFVPSIMHRIEALLLAIHSRNLQMNHYTQNVIPATKIMEALTTKSCQEMFSLESLETFGDSFLKYAASQQLFRDHEDCREGFLTTKRMAMISNEALYALGSKRELQGFIRNGCFNPKHWTVPGDYSKYFSEEMFTTMSVYKMGTRNFGRDVVADVVEALIGAYLSTAGEQSALIFMEWLGMQINFVNKIPEDRPLLVKPEIHEKISYLESLLKYSFHDRSLLVEALTHGSFLSPEFPRFYQRLEFLGDSVLDYLITVHMYNTYPGLSPELLTDLRSALVNNDCYACVAVRSGLHRYIWHSSPTLDKQISSFVNSFEQTYSGAVHGWEASTFVPKVLGDVIESIAGAILIDSGFDKGIVWESMRPLLEPLITPDTVKYNPLKELKALRTERSYVVVVCPTMLDGIASVTIEVEANGVTYSKTETASNMKDAEKLAAKSVLKQLKASIPGL